MWWQEYVPAGFHFSQDRILHHLIVQRAMFELNFSIGQPLRHIELDASHREQVNSVLACAGAISHGLPEEPKDHSSGAFEA